MQNHKNNETISVFESLKDTLKLMIIPDNISIDDRDDLIEFNLQELEGDFYTFINPVNLNKLYLENFIDIEVKFKLDKLFFFLQDIQDKEWNVDSFLINHKWLKIINLTKEIITVFES